ncbi:putative KDP operon transcriptional regulatory protein KdpE [Leptospira inadai serovar Lyme str. 10]|uniref:DNA-binding response regulator n=2 Tax=Leptospira inadai serovar Lyme TaxID=293084 RepID=A0ABX4YE85_9LEPT|nr:response regulator [Leptospira inadai]EQA37451.1 putative KDP operon transcriptional regulatory protein KdpE [Leptospira inadai serovar Lyme str. 10]PNV73009.1 DNA-binding response regulator [Leptospira inadai serovar Lyme]
MGSPVILVIDDEVQIRRLLRMACEPEGYKLEEAVSVDDALSKFYMVRPDIVVLDLGLPARGGEEFLVQIRESGAKVPVLVLSVKDSEKDKIHLLDIGADDYLTKPFGIGEFLARIRVLLRHSSPEKTDVKVKIGSLELDFGTRRVTKSGKDVRLTPTEYSFLKLLATYPGKIVTQTQILKELWGPNQISEAGYLRVYVNQIRKKIEADPSKPEILITEPGVGYYLKAENQPGNF